MKKLKKIGTFHGFDVLIDLSYYPAKGVKDEVKNAAEFLDNASKYAYFIKALRDVLK